MDSPFPEGTPIYSGFIDWTQVSYRLEEIEGTVRIRFRFGSDSYTMPGDHEGWYVDDVYLLPDTPSLSDTPEINLFPESVMLYQNQPNPFSSAHSTTRIRFDLSRESEVSLIIFDTSGRLVRTLENRALAPGRYTYAWDGSDARGHVVGSGLYFYLLDAQGRNLSKRMLIMK